MRRRIGLVMAMEEEMQQVEEQVELLADTDVEGSAETAMLEASDMESEVDDQMDDIDMVADSSDELSKLADVMEKTTENGGMDEQTAEVIEVAVEGIYSRMGVKRFAKMPALESFGEKTSRLQATRIAVEGVKEFVANAWKKIIEAISSASEFIMDFLKKIFVVNERMVARAQAYKGKLPTIKGKEKSSETVASGSFGKALAMSSEASDFGAELVVGLTDLVEAMVQSVTRAEAAASGNAVPSGGGNVLIKLDLSMGAKVGPTEGFNEAKVGMVITRSKMLPGGFAFVSEYLETGFKKDVGPDMIKEIKVSVGEFNPKKELAFKAATVKVASFEEMGKIVDGVIALAKSVTEGKAAADKLYSARKELVGAAKGLMSKEEKPEDVKVQQAFSTAYNKLSKNFMLTFNKHSVTTGMQALNYVQKSMEQYAGKAPAAKEEKAAA